MLVKFSLILVADTKIIFRYSFVEVASLIYWNLYFFDMEEGVAQTCSVKKVFLEILLKNRLWHRCFPVNFAKFLRTPFFTEHLWWLLLIW